MQQDGVDEVYKELNGPKNHLQRIRRSLNTKELKDKCIIWWCWTHYAERKKKWALHILDDDQVNIADEDHALDELVIGKFLYLILSLLHML